MMLIAGATGANGTELVKLLSSRGVPVRAMVRSPEGAKVIAALKGVELVVGDFDDPPSVERALQGVEKAFLLTNSTERAEFQQIGFVEAARRTGLKHIVKLSQFAADKSSPVRFLRYHAALERTPEPADTSPDWMPWVMRGRSVAKQRCGFAMPPNKVRPEDAAAVEENAAA